MTEGFGEGFVEWLGETTAFPVQIATNGAVLLPGHAYMAADRHQMGVAGEDRLLLTTDPPENSVRPSVSFLFRSVRRIYADQAIAILLTGMGRDGADELKLLRMPERLRSRRINRVRLFTGCQERLSKSAARNMYSAGKDRGRR